MRVVFIGATGFGLRCLDAVSKLEEIEIVGVLTSYESFDISYSQHKVKNVLYADFSSWAKDKSVSCYRMKKNMKEPQLVGWLEESNPDLLVVVGWYHMVPKVLREMAPAVGLHASLLPDYSGGAPLVWAIINGEKETGITLFKLGDGVDDGPIFGQARTPIFPKDNIATLYDRIEELGKNLLLENLPKIAAGKAVPVTQDESKRRIFPQRTPADGIIDWRQSAQSVYNFVRAQTSPYPGAFSYIEGEKIMVLVCKRSNQRHETVSNSPGSIIYDDNFDKVFVRAGDNSDVELVKIEVKGDELAAASFFRGFVNSKVLKFNANI